MDFIGVLDKGVDIPYPRPGVPVTVDPLGELEKRVTPRNAVADFVVRQLQPLARADLVGMLANGPAAGELDAAPVHLGPGAVPPLGDMREGISVLHVLPLQPEMARLLAR